MHTSWVDTQRTQDAAWFSKLTRRARRMASAHKKQSKAQQDFVDKDFKKLTYRARQMARKASLSPHVRQESAHAQLAGHSIAISTACASNPCIDAAAAKTCSIAECSKPGATCGSTNHLALRGVTPPSGMQPALTEAGSQWLISSQAQVQSSQQFSSLLLSAFAMGAAWAARPGAHFASSEIYNAHRLPLGWL